MAKVLLLRCTAKPTRLKGRMCGAYISMEPVRLPKDLAKETGHVNSIAAHCSNENCTWCKVCYTERRQEGRK